MSGGLALALTRAAHAQPAPVTWRLDYRVPLGVRGCPSEQSLIDQVARRLGRDPFTSYAPGTVHINVASAARGAFSVERAGSAATPPREITAPDCERLIDRIALSVSVVIDPLSLTRVPPAPPPPPPPPSPPPPPVVEVRPVAAVTQPPPRPRTPSFVLSLAVGAHAVFGAANPAAPGAFVRVSLRRAWFSVGLDARYDIPITTPMEGVAQGEFTSALAAATLGACVHYRWARGCGVFVVGALQRESRGIATPQEEVSPYLAGGVRAGVSIPLAGAWSIDLSGDVLVQSQVVPLVRETTGASGACVPSELRATHSAVWCPPLVAGVVTAGVAWRLPL